MSKAAEYLPASNDRARRDRMIPSHGNWSHSIRYARSQAGMWAAFVVQPTDNKTHKSWAARVVYFQHPMCGRDMVVHAERNRAGRAVPICCAHDDPGNAVLDIPAWMFDNSICCGLRAGVA